MKVARAAGFKDIRDVEGKVLKSFDPQTGSVLQTAQAAGIATGIMKGTAGIPSPVEALLLFLDSSPKPRPEDASRLIAWMPKEMASTPQEATAKLREIWTSAVAAALPDAKVEFAHEMVERKPALGKNYVAHLRYISIHKPPCSPCKISSQALGDRVPPAEVTAPDFLGSYPAYFWGGLGKQSESSFGGYPWTATDLTAPQKRDFLRLVSANLPEWAYLYLPNDDKKEQIGPFPVILHRGVELQFKIPDEDEDRVE